MKYWRGYLVAVIFAAITAALVAFAKAHSALVDMVYPYMTRTVINSLADWSAGVSFCLWQVIVLVLIAALLVSIILMLVLRWNFIQWTGWVLAVVCALSLGSTLLYGLNDYAGPLAEDIRLDVTDYTVSELNEATVYFRDLANEYAKKVKRDSDGSVNFKSFEKLSEEAAEGFQVLTYDQAISVFSGSTAPVKKLGWSLLYGKTAGVVMPLTGEAAVNPKTPAVALPFAMCTEMSRRMCISNYEEARFAAFMACTANSSEEFQYSAYCAAYYYCYQALSSIPTSTAESSAAKTAKGVSKQLAADLEEIEKFYGKPDQAPKGKSDTADLLASWYVQTFITPLHVEEEKPFDPTDKSQVDLTYKAPAPTPLPGKSK